MHWNAYKTFDIYLCLNCNNATNKQGEEKMHKPTYEQMLKMRLQTLNAVKGNLQGLISGKTSISEFTNGIEDAIKTTEEHLKWVKDDSE